MRNIRRKNELAQEQLSLGYPCESLSMATLLTRMLSLVSIDSDIQEALDETNLKISLSMNFDQVLDIDLDWAMALLLTEQPPIDNIKNMVKAHTSGNTQSDTAILRFMLCYLLLWFNRPKVFSGAATSPRTDTMNMASLLDILPEYSDPDDGSGDKEQINLIRHIIKYIENRDDEKLLLHLDSDIDYSRFISEDQYRTETLYGLVMTTSDDIFNSALSLAKKYQVTEWELFMASLEFLLTETQLDTSEIKERVLARKLVEHLCSNPKLLATRLQSNVYPLLNGRDHRQLLFYFTIIQKGCTTLPFANEAQAHKNFLRKITPHLGDIDFKLLIGGSLDDIEKFLGFSITETNVNTIAKSFHYSSNPELTPEFVFYLFLMKMYNEAENREEKLSNQGKLEKILGKLSSKYVLRFGEQLCRNPVKDLYGLQWLHHYIGANSERYNDVLDSPLFKDITENKDEKID